MKIFLSHAGRDKPIVREIRRLLPESLTIWLDEKDLPTGSHISETLKSVIKDSSNLVVLFISSDSLKSTWVQKELTWALEKEKTIGKTFIFPVVLESGVWENIEPAEFREKKYISLQDFSEESVKVLARRLEKEIFTWMVSSLDDPPKTPQRFYDFRLNIELKAGHIVSLNQFGGPDKTNMITLSMDKELKNKNVPNLGPPVILLTITNKGQDIEISDVLLNFGKTVDIKAGTIFDEAGAVSLTSLEHENSPPVGSFILKTNHKKEFIISAKVFIEQILVRGFDIEIIDVLKNKYQPSPETLSGCKEYLNHFFAIDGLSNLYKQS